MAGKRRKKGAIEWVDIGRVLRQKIEKAIVPDEDGKPGKLPEDFEHPLDGVEVGIVHIGPGKAEDWGLELQALKVDEMKRIAEMRRGFTEEETPQLFKKGPDGNVKFSTPDGMRSMLDFAEQLLTEGITGIRNYPEFEPDSNGDASAEIAKELRRLGVSYSLIDPVIRMQRLEAEDIFAEGAGDVGSK